MTATNPRGAPSGDVAPRLCSRGKRQIKEAAAEGDKDGEELRVTQVVKRAGSRAAPPAYVY